MKLINCSNLEFKCEEENEISFNEWLIVLYYKCKYWFNYASSFYFRIISIGTIYRHAYRSGFINNFKKLKKEIERETSEFC